MVPFKVNNNRLPQGDLEFVAFLNGMRKTKSEVGVIIPTLNEEKTIASVIERTKFYVDKILVIDGGSEDRTVEIAKEIGIDVVFQESRGKGAAMREAFDHIDSEFIVVLDADGSMRPEEIPNFLKGIYSGADIVKGSRFIYNGDSEDITFFRRFGNSLFISLINLMWGTNYTDLCYGFMAFRKDAIEKLSPILRSKGFGIETEIIIKAKKLGLRTVEVPSVELKRLFGNSKLNTFRDGLKILMTILREIFL